MFNWFLTKLTDHWEKKCQKEMGGLPLLWVIYHADRPVPNIDFRLHPMFTGDMVLNAKCKEIADHMRNKYLEVKENEDENN